MIFLVILLEQNANLIIKLIRNLPTFQKNKQNQKRISGMLYPNGSCCNKCQIVSWIYTDKSIWGENSMSHMVKLNGIAYICMIITRPYYYSESQIARKKMLQEWMECGGPLAYPLGHLIWQNLIWLWGHVRNTVYKVHPTTVFDMKERIKNSFA